MSRQIYEIEHPECRKTLRMLLDRKLEGAGSEKAIHAATMTLGKFEEDHESDVIGTPVYPDHLYLMETLQQWHMEVAEKGESADIDWVEIHRKWGWLR